MKFPILATQRFELTVINPIETILPYHVCVDENQLVSHYEDALNNPLLKGN